MEIGEGGSREKKNAFQTLKKNDKVRETMETYKGTKKRRNIQEH
jgi:hypothetical protein